MANPNKTVAAFRQRNPRPVSDRPVQAWLQDIMDKVSTGAMTPDEAAQKVRESMENQ